MKIGRNDPCLCGSGKKYKKCCLDKEEPALAPIPPDVKHQFEKIQALQDQIEKQQGLGRPIISTVFKGYRLVSSGARLHWQKQEKWRTFHDFLFYYLQSSFGTEWGQEQLKKDPDAQHPVMQWHIKLSEHKRKHSVPGKDIQTAPMTGATMAILSLAYNLFLLEHNIAIQKTLIERLKSTDMSIFHGALYETYVAAVFIRAGFKLRMENEDDPTSSHCEFIAEAPNTGEMYSVEAKARQPNKEHLGIRRQLGKALAKDTSFKRVIFIDVNVPRLKDKVSEVDKELQERETSQEDVWRNAPAAYVFITNHSFSYDLESEMFEKMGFAYGFKIDYFKGNTEYTSLREAHLARDKHIDMVGLIKSMKEQNTIPITFDGDIPEFAFNEDLQRKRLLIGNKYLIPDKEGKDVVGILETATISEHEKVAYGSYRLEDGTRIMCTNPVSDEELAAYKRHADTFFGVPRQQGRKADDSLELFDFFYESYKKAPRDRLLGFMKNRPDIESLKKLTDEELLTTCCEGWVYSAMLDSKKKDKEETTRKNG